MIDNNPNCDIDDDPNSDINDVSDDYKVLNDKDDIDLHIYTIFG